MTPEQYNKKTFGQGIWRLEDIPKEWGWGGQDWVSLTQHVYAFQRERFLVADGKIGPQTASALKQINQPKQEGVRVWPDGRKSAEKLATCHPDLIKLITAVRDDSRCPMLFTVTCGHRGEEEQNDAYARGASKVQWPNGKHNSFPSVAVDLAPHPYPSEEELEETTARLARFVKIKAIELGIRINAGLDWGWDYFHFELRAAR